MDQLVYYHHPEAENFSLSFSSGSRSEVLQRQKETNSETKLMDYSFDTPVYVLYESDVAVESASEVEYDQEWLSERISELPRSGEVVAFRLVELFEAAVDARKDDEFKLYKEFEPQKIQQALDHVSWGTSLPEVAGELMSNLILRHSLPNANHRTGIAMLQLCIESVEPEFDMPSTHLDDHNWKEWVNRYIVTSKQLITVRRNNVRFQHLENLGVDTVERKDGIQIGLAEFDLDMHWRDALSVYADRHETHCTDFAQALLERKNRDELKKQQGPTKSEFVEFLETGVIDRDFREMF